MARPAPIRASEPTVAAIYSIDSRGLQHWTDDHGGSSFVRANSWSELRSSRVSSLGLLDPKADFEEGELLGHCHISSSSQWAAGAQVNPLGMGRLGGTASSVTRKGRAAG